MKKICALIALSFGLNAHAQTLNLGAVFSGNTADVICYVHGAPADPTNFSSISCANKNGQVTGAMSLGKQANENAILAGFVGSGRWDLATSFMGKNNTVSFIFTKK